MSVGVLLQLIIYLVIGGPAADNLRSSYGIIKENIIIHPCRHITKRLAVSEQPTAGRSSPQAPPRGDRVQA